MGMGSWWNAADRGENPVPMLPCPTQILYGLAWDQTCASTVTGQRLTAGTLAQSIIVCNIAIILLHFVGILVTTLGPGVAWWLRHCATRQTVPGSIPGGVTGFFQ